MRVALAAALAATLTLAPANAAHHHHHHHHHPRRHFGHPHVFGTKPLAISIGATHAPPNGPSGGAAISGDNRKARLAAFQSAASNLIRGDTNGVTDVFIWHRPRGRAGVRLGHLMGHLRRVSVNNDFMQANGASIDPSLDGSLHTVPHCVAFQSRATNLSPRDTEPDWDIYVRDLKTRLTYLVSADVGAPATHPSIDGQCHNVAFQAAGSVWVGAAHGGTPMRISPGARPRFARDGRALVWTHRGLIRIRRAGHSSTVARGTNPHVSDKEFGLWGVVFDTRKHLLATDRDSHRDVYMRVLGARGGSHFTVLISKVKGGNAFNGGITVFGQNRGIATFAIRENHGWGVWYYNKHTGHADDLAFARRGKVHGLATSARANFIAFTTSQRLSPSAPRGRYPLVYFKGLVDGESYRNAY